MKKSVALTLMCGWSCLTGYGAISYVNRATGNDAFDGATANTAKRTIQAAVAISSPGDTVMVAPGIYDEGTTVTPSGYLANRVVVTKNITLKSTHGAEETIIMGARDPIDTTYKGCGSNAVRCVYMNAGTLEGFTLTGGASGSEDKQDINNRGGGLYSSIAAGPPILYDCIISNNVAMRGGGAFQGTLHRCLVSDNAAKVNGGGVRESVMHDSLIVYNTNGGTCYCYPTSTTRTNGVYNCTVAYNTGTGLDQSSGFNTISVGNTKAFTSSSPSITFDNCCLSEETSIGTNNIITTNAGFIDAANRDFRLSINSPCLDAADPELIGKALAAADRTDYLGNPRLQGAGLDIGAIERVASNIAIVYCLDQSEAGSIAPLGEFVLPILPTQLIFTATADTGAALRHFTVNGAKMMECGNTFTLNVTQPNDYIVSGIFLPARYVDAEAGSDANDGTAPASAWRTLQYAVDTAPNGAMVLAAPGFYDEGGRDGVGSVTNLMNRVVISRNIVLKGSGAGHSFIMGASDPAGDTYGCGPNAVRCVQMTAGTVEGFTVTGGRSSTEGTHLDWINRGGGFAVDGFTSGQIWDCIISNNVAARGGAVFGGIYHRCRIEENMATVYGINRYGICYDSLFARNAGWVNGEGVKLYNCTVTANERGIQQITSVSAKAFLYNSIIYGNAWTDVQEGTWTVATNCCTGVALYPGAGNIAANPLFADAANGNYRLHALSPCTDTGDVAYTFEPDGTDLVGAQRVIGSQVNMGAFEGTVGGVNAIAAPGTTLTPSGLLTFDSYPTSQTFTVTSPPGRTLRYFIVNGVPVPNTGNTITLSILSQETALLLQTQFEGLFYADPSRPDDSGDGGSWATAKRTLQAAVELAFDGESVLAAPGVYSEGTRPTPTERSSNGYLNNRVFITNNITLRSRDGAASTIILGALDTGSGDAYGRGPNAARGVYMSNGTLEGFTITGGATGNDGTEDENNRGGGLYAPALNYTSLILDCVISNNASHRGGGTHCSTLKRCRILDNYASVNGAGMRDGYAHNCLIAGNRGTSATAYAKLYNCTVVKNSGAGISSVTRAYNSISSQNNGDQVSANATCTNCCSDTLAPGAGNIAADPLFVDAAAGDYRLSANSPCLDRGSLEFVEDLFGSDLDGAMRTQNGLPDLGAYEWDWRPTLAADLDARGLTVAEVTPFVTHAVDAAYIGGSAVYLDGAAALANGQETVALSICLNKATASTVYLSFQVDGSGTLALFEDDVPIASSALADGYQTLKHTVLNRPGNLRAVYTVGEGESGGALLDAFENASGALLLLR